MRRGMSSIYACMLESNLGVDEIYHKAAQSPVRTYTSGHYSGLFKCVNMVTNNRQGCDRAFDTYPLDEFLWPQDDEHQRNKHLDVAPGGIAELRLLLASGVPSAARGRPRGVLQSGFGEHNSEKRYPAVLGDGIEAEPRAGTCLPSF